MEGGRKKKRYIGMIGWKKVEGRGGGGGGRREDLQASQLSHVRPRVPEFLTRFVAGSVVQSVWVRYTMWSNDAPLKKYH